MVFSYKNTRETKSNIRVNPEEIDLANLKELLQDLDDQFVESYNTGDSLAIAEHFTID